VHLDLEILNAQIAWEFPRARSSWDERQLRFELHCYRGWLQAGRADLVQARESDPGSVLSSITVTGLTIGTFFAMRRGSGLECRSRRVRSN
jgi:3-deoxy-D-arabino-heptulosonate 7-phosphate (DAHP) synthase class II